jgi:hypothetical protein
MMIAKAQAFLSCEEHTNTIWSFSQVFFRNAPQCTPIHRTNAPQKKLTPCEKQKICIFIRCPEEKS